MFTNILKMETWAKINQKHSILSSCNQSPTQASTSNSIDTLVTEFFNENDKVHDDVSDIEDDLKFNSDDQNEEDLKEDEIEQGVLVDQEAIDELISNNYNKRDLTAALLTLFYAGKFTQSAFNLTLSLIQWLANKVKMPSSIDILSIECLSWSNETVTTNKKWYFSHCLKSFEQLGNRFQRNCSVCSTR